MIKGLHHVGFEVKDLEEAIAFYEQLGFEVLQRFEYPAAKFVAAMLTSEQLGGVELFEFNDPNHKLVEKIRHHSAFQTDDLEADLQSFLDQGCKLAIPISKGRVVKRYAYVKDAHGNYIELLEP